MEKSIASSGSITPRQIVTRSQSEKLTESEPKRIRKLKRPFSPPFYPKNSKAKATSERRKISSTTFYKKKTKSITCSKVINAKNQSSILKIHSSATSKVSHVCLMKKKTKKNNCLECIRKASKIKVMKKRLQCLKNKKSNSQENLQASNDWKKLDAVMKFQNILLKSIPQPAEIATLCEFILSGGEFSIIEKKLRDMLIADSQDIWSKLECLKPFLDTQTSDELQQSHLNEQSREKEAAEKKIKLEKLKEEMNALQLSFDNLKEKLDIIKSNHKDEWVNLSDYENDLKKEIEIQKKKIVEEDVAEQEKRNNIEKEIVRFQRLVAFKESKLQPLKEKNIKMKQELFELKEKLRLNPKPDCQKCEEYREEIDMKSKARKILKKQCEEAAAETPILRKQLNILEATEKALRIEIKYYKKRALLTRMYYCSYHTCEQLFTNLLAIEDFWARDDFRENMRSVIIQYEPDFEYSFLPVLRRLQYRNLDPFNRQLYDRMEKFICSKYYKGHISDDEARKRGLLLEGM